MFEAVAALYCTGLIMESARALWILENEPGSRDRAKEFGKFITAVSVILVTVFWPFRFARMGIKFLTRK